MFREEDDDEPDYQQNQNQFESGRPGVDEEEEDEEDLHEEEADQVFDDFGAGLMGQQNQMDNRSGIAQ